VVPTQVQQNSIQAITNLFAPRPGILMTNLFVSDLIEVIANASPGLVSYIQVNAPTGSMIVTAPESPQITYTITDGGGTLGPGVYAYSVSTNLSNGDIGFPTSWTFPQVIGNTNSFQISLTWPAVVNAVEYQVWGRSAEATIGLLATISAGQPLAFTDNGSITPGVAPPDSADFPIRYNSLNSLNISVEISDRQQRPFGTDPTRLLGES